MALGLLLLFAILILLFVMALFIIGIILIVVGASDKKKGGKGKAKIIGIVMVATPILLFLCIGGKILFDNARIKCVADEWRYKPYFMPRNSITSSENMLRSMLESVDDKDKETIYREFSANVREDRHFKETVDDFINDIDRLGIDLDPDDFLTDYGKDVHLEVLETAGTIYSADIDGETYYCYVRICYGALGDKDDVGLQQFIICTKDKLDELNKIIEDGDDDIYFEVL